MNDRRSIFCVECDKNVDARLTNGTEIYPHRSDLGWIPFWKHDACGNYVGCHHKTANPTFPLGCIPTKELMEKRKQIHAIIDSLWQSGNMKRSAVYKAIGRKLGRKHAFHTAGIRSVDEAERVIKAAGELTAEIQAA